VAVLLERLIDRDEHTFSEAAEIIRTNFGFALSDHELSRIRGELLSQGANAIKRPRTQKSKPGATSQFEIVFPPDFPAPDVKEVLTAFADYFRACGGIGLTADFEGEQVKVREGVNA
jgi:hypothetical protein